MTVKKSKVVKILIVVFLALAVLVPLFINISKYSNDYDFIISNYEMEAVIDSNGDMHVVEKVTNKYSDRNTVFYKNLIYGKNNSFSSDADKSSLVEDVRVKVEDSSGIVFDTDTDLGSYNHFVGYSYNLDRDERGDLIRCESSVKDCAMIFYYDKRGISEVTTFTYEYTIKGVVTEYGDISELNWVMLGYQPMNVKNVKIKITLPEGDYNIAEERTWFHGSNNAKREFISDNEILISTDKLVKNEQIEVRLLVNKDVFSNISANNKVSVNRLDDIIVFQNKQTKGSDVIYYFGLYGSIVIFALCLAYLVFLVYKCYNKYDKEFKSDFYNEYYRELPASYPPAVMGYLYKYREVDDKDLTATLLDLVRRKYLILDNPSDNVNEKNPDYTIKLNKESDINELTELEKHLIKWFIEDIGDGEKVKSRQLSSYCDSYSNAQSYQENNSKWVDLIEKEANKYDFFDKTIKEGKSKYSGLGLLTIIGIAILFILKSISELDIGMLFGISLIFVLIAYLVYVNSFDRRSKAGNEDYVRWKAFKKFLEEFSTFEDYPVPSLIVWEHYLVYATSFGIAEKVTSQLKLKFKLDEINDQDTTFILYYGLRYNYMMNLNRTIVNSRMNAVSTIARHTASRAGSGRSGGGFSGGSSFGGGGGSFGGR